MWKKPSLWIIIGVLGSLLALAVCWPQTRPMTKASGEEDNPPAELELTGIVRDFRKSHVDFAVSGSGHDAGTVENWLPGSRRPEYTGLGFKVEQQWRDRLSRPIAPHIAGVRGGLGGGDSLGLWVSDEIELGKDTHVDAFNSNFGRYGERGNYGGRAVVNTNSTDEDAVTIERYAVMRADVNIGPGGSPATAIDNKGVITGQVGVLAEVYDIPDLLPPDDLDSYEAHVHLEGPIVLTGDTNLDDDEDVPAMHFGRLHIHDDSVITIDGDLRILCENELVIKKAQIRLLPEANLTFYVRSGKVDIKYGALINTDEADTTRVSFNVLGPGSFKVDKGSHVYATIIAPDRKLKIKEAHVYGAFIGKSLELEGKDAGFHVDAGNSRPGDANYALALRDKLEIEEHSYIDSFDSDLGPYGGSNVAADAFVTTNAVKKDHVKIKKYSTVKGDVLVGAGASPNSVIKLEGDGTIEGMMGTLALPRAIPVVSPPTMGESQGDVHLHGGHHTINEDLRCKKLALHEGAVLEIVGDITIRCDDKVELKDASVVNIAAGSRLTLYVKKDLKLDKDCEFNVNTGNPQLVTVRRTSVGKKGKIELKHRSRLVAWVEGAKTEMKIEDGSEFFGSFAGRKLKIKDESAFHVDMAGLRSCIEIADQSGAMGDAAQSAITSADSFGQWYRDVLGVNQSMSHILTLTRNAGGVYEYSRNAFYPIDGRLYGDEGEPHNNNFSFVIQGTFCYDSCAGQFLELEGGDGLWAYVNNNLVIDLGGLGPGTSQIIELDRLGLVGGETYPVSIFYAQRRSTPAPLRIRTNIVMTTGRSVPNVTAQYD